jgi:hypothetical protein
VDLSTFDFALGNSTCLCDLKKIEVADDAMQIALDQMKGGCGQGQKGSANRWQVPVDPVGTVS